MNIIIYCIRCSHINVISGGVNFYDDLNTTLNSNKAHYNIIMGNFNAKIGQGNEDCVGKFGYGERNERGEDLINFAMAHNFKITNTYFQKKSNKKWTW